MSVTPSRRDFLKTASLSAAAVSMSAASYARVKGANERINLGLIGCGRRGVGAHMAGVHNHDKDENVQFVAVCDPWKVSRDSAAERVKEWYGIDAKQFVHYEELLALDDVDAVMIASCDHQHTIHLEATAKAGKDTYCEKPLANDFASLKTAVEAVEKSGIICQIGTQLRSYPSFTGARAVVESGVLGTISRVEQVRNSADPYWYGYIRDVKQEDVAWDVFDMGTSSRSFDPVAYSAWMGYMEYSQGPVPQLGVHFLDLVHYIMGSGCPSSAVCQGGAFIWKDEHEFTAPDQVNAQYVYPEGFMVSYTSNFGNGSGNLFKVYGTRGTMDLTDWNNPKITKDGCKKGETPLEPGDGNVAPVERPNHVLNWLRCLRTRETPHAPIQAGYDHSIASIMAVESLATGRRQTYDFEKKMIVAG
ncbi:MAG: Gfo/Idh/MocA family oxidoreductase [Candidatus Hydrogenedentes bacterium]|nr:Gfo/Idh/MocA family oxidoreductase [Candidatus Hydrogenedentota bacterium]